MLEYEKFGLRFFWDIECLVWGCLGCGMLELWDVEGVGCSRWEMFKMWYVWMWNIWDVWFLEYGIFGMWYVWDLGCLRCGMFKLWDIGDVECLGCGMLLIWNNVWDLGSGMCDLWSLGCWLRKPVFENIAYQKNIRNSLKFYSDLSQNFIDNLKLDRSNQSYILRIFEQRGKSFKFCLTKW